MRATVAVINAKYGGSAFAPPAERLLSGGGLTVPDVRGQSLEQAKQLLEGLGFGFKDGGQVDSELPAGKVAASDPPAGTSSARGAVITVYTSKANKVPFIDVVLDGMTNNFGAAQGMLNPDYPDVTELCEALPPGTLPGDPREDKVKASNPAPGAYVVPGAPVTLTVTKLVCP